MAKYYVRSYSSLNISIPIGGVYFNEFEFDNIELAKAAARAQQAAKADEWPDMFSIVKEETFEKTVEFYVDGEGELDDKAKATNMFEQKSCWG